jgi:hypothetical protein
MSSLKGVERIRLEKFLQMGGGYVCNFSDRTFGEFVLEMTGIDVYTSEYAEGGTSKANRLRTFWRKAPNQIVAKLTREMLVYWRSQKESSSDGLSVQDTTLFAECIKIVERLEHDNPIDDAEAFRANSPDRDFTALAKSIRESIGNGKPSDALDRLHTFLMRYLRELCTKHSITYDKDTPLHSLFGAYAKFLHEQKTLESVMSERILKSSISILDAFNSVRNNQSYAHPNPVLNHHEAVLIFNNVSNTLRYIEVIEHKIAAKTKARQTRDEVTWDDIPF